METLKDSLRTVLLSLILLFFVGVAYAWTEPTANPPLANNKSPLTVDNSLQYKEGALGVGGLFKAYSTAIFEGNVGIGTQTPQEKLSVAGVIETAGGIKFSDNTVQTTSSTNSNTSFVTGTYIGSGVSGRLIKVGFDPDYVVTGKLDIGGFGHIQRWKYSTLSQSQAISDYNFYSETILSLTSGQGSNGGFTVGNSDYVNTVGIKYVYTAIKGGVTPQVGPVTIDSLTVSPTIIGQGQGTTISWSTTGAASCAAGGIWSGNKFTSGSEVIYPNAGIQTITLTCYNSDASLSDTKSVTVDVRPWQGVNPPDGNLGESCDGWLARTGQTGVNGSAPASWGPGWFLEGQCTYGTDDAGIADIYGLQNFGSPGYIYYGHLPSNYYNGLMRPIHWHCCGDRGDESNTQTRR